MPTLLRFVANVVKAKVPVVALVWVSLPIKPVTLPVKPVGVLP